MNKSIQHNYIEKGKYNRNKIKIIAGIIAGLIFFLLWIFTIKWAENPMVQHYTGIMPYFAVILWTVPLAMSIGLIIDGTIMILKQKNFITDKSNKTFKIIKKIFGVIGGVFVLGGVFLLFIIKINFDIFFLAIWLIIIGIFLLFLGYYIPIKSKQKNKRKRDESIS